MNLNSISFSKQRRTFGRQCTFSDRNEVLFSIPQRGDLRQHYILRNPVNHSTQLSVQKAESEALTENVALQSRGLLHIEGGWPKDVNILDEEATTRHRKKVERDDAWGVQVLGLSKLTQDCILQNSAVNIYEDFFSEQEMMEVKSSFQSRPVNLYHDLIFPGRPIVQLDWNPAHPENLLSLHSNLEYYPTKTSPNEFYLWDIENPLKVLLTFEGPTWVRKACYCPRDETLIAGGFINGKVGIWDARIGGQPVEICPLEAAHREAVSALCWVHSKSNTEFYTGSADSSIFYWDGRNLKNWYMQFLLDPEKTDKQIRSRAHGATVLEFEYTIPIRYIVGDDMGHIFIGNRKGMTPMEALINNFKLFAGPIRSIERNPFFVKNFLIIGDWMAKVWSEECKDFPTTLIIKTDVQFLCGAWSTSRCSVFATGDMNGVVKFWDLLLNQRVPVFSLSFKDAVNTIKFRKDGELVAVGLSNGDIQLLELDTALRTSGPKEKGLLASLFERETNRSRLLQDRVEEIKLKAALAAAAAAAEYDEFGEYEGGGDDEDAGEEGEDRDTDPQYTQVRNAFLETITQIQEKWMEREFISQPCSFEDEGFENKSYDDVIGEEEEEG